MSHSELERLWDGRVIELAPRNIQEDSPSRRARLRNILDYLPRLPRFDTGVAGRLTTATLANVRTFAGQSATRKSTSKRALSTRWERLATTPLPGITVLRDGSFLILGRAAAEEL